MDEKFKPLTATPVVDPTKHVNYTYGMVLGVDDFTQEFAYHAERDQWMTRDIDGYGTVSGLRVTVAKNTNEEHEVIVSAGTAVNPRGQMICVPVAQCAVIDKWLAVEANNKAAADAAAQLPEDAPLGLYVVLCYRDCPVDKVPVPGEPCRSEDEAVANSRLKDDFRLELRLAPPAQTEERAVREFVGWLREHVEFTDDAGEFTDLDSFVEAVRGYAGTACPASPPDSPPGPGEDSPPFVMRVPADLRCDYLRAALRVWVTELRPRCRPSLPGAHCCSCGDESHDGAARGGDEDCVLLAELQVHLIAGSIVDAERGVSVIEDDRPLLFHQRMLQEWLTCGSCCGGESVGPPPIEPPLDLALDDLTDVSVPAPAANDVLTFDGTEWIAAAPPAGGGGATGPAEGDLSGTYPAPTVVQLQGRPVVEDEPTENQVLTWDGKRWGPAEAIQPGDAAGGDLGETYPDPIVTGLQSHPVSKAQPVKGDVLTWFEEVWGDGEDERVGRWEPMQPDRSSPEATSAMLPFVTVIEGFTDQSNVLFLWFHLDAPGNRTAITKFPPDAIKAFGERSTPGRVGFFNQVEVLSLEPAEGWRNLFRCELAQRPSLLRLVFNLKGIQMHFSDGDALMDGPLSDYVRQFRLNFIGHDGDGVVTAFVAGLATRQIIA